MKVSIDPQLNAASLPELTEAEQREYSYARAIAVAGGLLRGNSLEREYHDAAGAAVGFNRGFLVPLNIGRQAAALDTSTGGGAMSRAFVPELAPAGFVELLVAQSLILSLGATWLSDGRLPAGIPVHGSADDTVWFVEGDAPLADQADSEVGLVSFGLHTAAASEIFSKQLLALAFGGSITTETFVRRSLARRIAAAWDRVSIAGSGIAGEPLGLLGTAGIGDVPIGANGGVPTWAHMVALERTVAESNAEHVDLGPRGYVSTPRIRELLKQTERAAGSGFVWDGASVNGHPAAVSTQVPSDLTKGTAVGTCHAILYGAWQQLVLLTAGVLDLVVDPVSRKRRGLVEVLAFSYGDVKPLVPAAFAAVQDAALS